MVVEKTVLLSERFFDNHYKSDGLQTRSQQTLKSEPIVKRGNPMDEQQILSTLDRIKEIPTLPAIVFELNKYLQDPDTSIKTVCETIEKDQSITLKILT